MNIFPVDRSTKCIDVSAHVLTQKEGAIAPFISPHHAGVRARAYGAASVPPEISAVRKIAGIIKSEKLTQISTREIQRRDLAGLGSAKQIGPAISVLCDADWIAQIQSAGSGRPKKVYAVNPKVGAIK